MVDIPFSPPHECLLYLVQVNELLEFPDNPRCLLVSAVDTSRSHSMFT